jgi:NAD(P)H dehydrogenase (quinone)
VHVLVVHAHPDPTSFVAALTDTAVRALGDAGHDVRCVRLYEEGFRADMSAAERHAYHSPTPLVAGDTPRHAALVRWAEALVFVYPTWWAGPPAILKGWLDRVLVPGVAFDFDARTGRVVPRLQRIRAIVGITTYGSPRWFSFLVGDAGRRTFLRTLWLDCSWRTRRVWLGLHGIESTTPELRAAFLARVERRLRTL